MTWEVREGHVLDVLQSLESESVQTVVTSPPYWGLRDYGLEPQVWGGRECVWGGRECEHEWADESVNLSKGDTKSGFNERYFGRPFASDKQAATASSFPSVVNASTCLRCNAWRGSLGLEPTPDLYVEHIVQVFREVRRVLRKDGTCWANFGDSYSGGPANSGGKNQNDGGIPYRIKGLAPKRGAGLKPKDLCGIPWRVAFALQADGWWLRSEIIWSKPNPMPESVTDRPTRAHEYVFLLTRSARYFYDADEVREPHAEPKGSGGWQSMARRGESGWHALYPKRKVDASRNDRESANAYQYGAGRNLRSVWSIPTEPFSGREFAGDTFYTRSEDCLEHGLHADPESWRRAASGEPQDWTRYRIDGTVARLALERLGESASSSPRIPVFPASSDEQMPESMDGNRMPSPLTSADSPAGVESSSDHTTHTQSSHVLPVDSWDSQGHSGSPTANPHSTESHKMASSSTPSDTAFEETPNRIDDKRLWSEELGLDDSGNREASQTVARTGRKCSCLPPSIPDHFATFPKKLVEPCVKAGSRVGDTVLDPFCGSGTVGVVALHHGRNFVGIELNPEYAQMAKHRIEDDAPLFNRIEER